MKSGYVNNVGSKFMYLQEQYNHQKRLQAIYQKNIKDPNTTGTRMALARIDRRTKEGAVGSNISQHKGNGESNFVKEEHLKNIKKLLTAITEEKTNQQRLKDPNDFMAYPTYFFRKEAETAPVKKGMSKTKRRDSRSVVEHEESVEVESISL